MKGRGALDRMASSPANYWVGFGLDGCISVSLVAAGFATTELDLIAPVAALVGGGLSYTFTEYALHRWVYHGPASPVRAIHSLHHDDTEVTIGAPFFYSLAVSAIIWALASLVLGPALAAVFAGTVLFGYGCQSAVHHLIHGARFREQRLFRALRRHHLTHHSRGGGNFGVTTMLWDRVFGTELRRGGKR